ncbi:class I poly(R)-hydroxyalkanoic acid synthase, partial [Halomonas sp. 707D4]|nr:class I poly(R)-hydroxyalkanoic acid synthase [Halomonas sp. 707D4]
MQSAWSGAAQGFTQEEMSAWKRVLDEVGEQYQGLMEDLLARMAPSEAADSVYSDMRASFEAAAQALMGNPALVWQTQARLAQDQWLLWQQGMRALAGEAVTPLIQPAKGDRR